MSYEVFQLDASGVKEEHRGAVGEYLRLVLQSMNVKPRYMVQTLDNKPYLERIVLHRDGEHGAGAYLHVIWESDLDKDPHDHPFDFDSQIVWGGYTEERFERWCSDCDIFWLQDRTRCEVCDAALVAKKHEKPGIYKAGSIVRRRAHQLHRLTLLEVPTVTLVTRGPKVREWGFMTPDGWQASRDWIKINKPDASTEVE